MTMATARRTEIEQNLNDLVRQGVGPENANYRELVSERDSLDTVTADHAARVAQHEREAWEKALHDRRVEHLRSRAGVISESTAITRALVAEVHELAVTLGKKRSELQEAISTGRVAGEQIKGASLDAQVPVAQIDLAIMHTVQNNGLPLRGVQKDPAAHPVSYWTEYAMDGIANEVKHLARGSEELGEALQGIEL